MQLSHGKLVQFLRERNFKSKILWILLAVTILICGAVFMALKSNSQDVHHLTPMERFSREIPNTTWNFSYDSTVPSYDNRGTFHFGKHDTFRENGQSKTTDSGHYQLQGNRLYLTHDHTTLAFKYYKHLESNNYYFDYMGPKGHYLPAKDQKSITMTLSR